MVDDLVVLVLEDQPFQRRMVTDILVNLGVAEVLEASDGKEAFQIIDRYGCAVDVVICDLEMDGMDGIEFLRHLAENKLSQSVIIASGMSEDLIQTVADLANILCIPILGAIKKPVTRDRLVSALEKYSRIPPPVYRPASAGVSPISVEEMHGAIQAGQILPYFQPKVAIKTGLLVGVEALARWRSPKWGLVQPGEFIPAMEAHGMIDGLTRIMLTKSLRSLSQWMKKGLEPSMAINLSPKVIVDTQLPDLLVRVCGHYQIPHEKVIFEISESSVPQDSAKFIEILSRIRMRGFGLSIDDYGTGYSTLDQLGLLPFSELKIDRSFVVRLNTSKKCNAIVESTIHMAHQLNLTTVVEGVETVEQLNTVAEMGADLIQGYHVAKPMDEEAFLRWTEHRVSRRYGDEEENNPKELHKHFLSASSPKPRAESHSSPELDHLLKKARILIVDDQTFVLNMLAEILATEQVPSVYKATTMKGAVSTLESEICDLVITDVELGEESGLDLLKTIRCGLTAAKPDLPVIVLTAHATHRAIGIAMALDASGFLVKPLKFQEVKHLITGALASRKPIKTRLAYEVIPTTYEDE